MVRSRNVDIARCPKRSLLPSHYRPDGSCLCVPRLCFKCGKDLDKAEDVGIAAFRRRGLRFIAVPGVQFCKDCGSNGKNKLSDEECRSLLEQE